MSPAQAFLDALYARQTGVLELRTFDHPKANDLRDFVPIREGRYDQEKVLKFLSNTEQYKLGAFFGVALRTPASIKTRKGDAAHCQTLTALFVDADFKHLGEEETRRRIAAFPLPPSIQNNSGGGLHPFWLLSSPLYLQVGKGMDTAKFWLQKLANHISDVVDTSVSEPARVLRIPGSFNFKKHYGQPRPVVNEILDPSRVYTLEQFGEILGIEPRQARETVDTPSESFKVPSNISQGGRHEILYKFLRSQKARGVSLEVALVGCHGLNQEQCQPPIPREELDSYLRRVWHQGDSPEFKAQAEAVKGFILSADGEKILPKNQENVRIALDKLGVKLSFNSFSQRPIIAYNGSSGTYQDAARNRVWLEIDKRFTLQIPDQYFDTVTDDLARKNKFHPVVDYLASLTWDGIPRIDEWLIRYGQATDSEYTRAVSAIVLIAAVRRVRQPGCKFDEMLVLESSQGLQKSSALVALCKDDLWFGDDLPLNVDAKQIIERTAGKWIIEAAELSGMHASKVEHLKAMLSRQVDGPVRMAYAHLPVEQPRQFIIIGTTNSSQYLSDDTGNRRFWPVKVESFDVAGIRKDRDQLWAEAAHREAARESIRLPQHLWSQAEMHQEHRRTEDPWEHLLSSELEDHYQRLAPNIVWSLVNIPIERQDAANSKRLAKIMQRLGFKRQAIRDPQTNKVVMGWARGAKLDDE